KGFSAAATKDRDFTGILGAVRITGLHPVSEELVFFDLPHRTLGPLPAGQNDLIDLSSSAPLPAPDAIQTYEASISPPQTQTVPLGEGALTAEDRCCLAQLMQHLSDNGLHYNRAIWLTEDPNERAMRFASATIAGVPLLDLIENRSLDVIGDLV